MKIFVSGATGLVGSELVRVLRTGGHDVRRLVRSKSQAAGEDVLWNPAAGQLEAADLEGADAVVNLAGESIAAGRWTARKKKRIRESRIDTARTIASTVAKLARRPRVLINASAVGYYGNRGDELLNEDSAVGSGDFLSGICRDWEAATESAANAGVRVVLARFGVILSGKGGALKKMLLPFRLGLGGRIGDGRQYMSWVAIDDVVSTLMHCLASESLVGPVNVVAPAPVTNAQFTAILGRVLSRPTIFPMPAFAARAAFGQMADELLLASQRVQPKKLRDDNYIFRYAELEPALRYVLGRP
jgi:uncharacterized protein